MNTEAFNDQANHNPEIIESLPGITYDPRLLEAEWIGKNGLGEEEILSMSEGLKPIFQNVQENLDSANYPFLRHAEDPEQKIGPWREIARQIPFEPENVVVVGIGGASRSLKLFDGFMTGKARPMTRYVGDTIDRPHLRQVFSDIEQAKGGWEKTLVLVISSSGATLETIVGYQAIKARMNQANCDVASHTVFVIGTEGGDLVEIAQKQKSLIVPISPPLCDRLDTLTSTGLFGGMILGVDPKEVLAGAKAMFDKLRTSDMGSNAAWQMALHDTLLQRQLGLSYQLVASYSSRLAALAGWWGQAHHESTGKGDKGIVVFNAAGPEWHHDMLQPLLAGPLLPALFIREGFSDGDEQLSVNNSNALQYLEGKSVNDLTFATSKVARAALALHGRPSAMITVDSLTDFNLGGLLGLGMGHLIYYAAINGISVQELTSQPAVHLGRQAINHFAGKPRAEAPEIMKLLSQLGETTE